MTLQQLPMTQLSLFGESVSTPVVNIATVPHRSPFRYPGGKTWLVPRIRQWLVKTPRRPAKFIEPFAGGAIVSLTVAFEKLAENVVLVEKDEQVAAVWHTIINDEGGAPWLANEIISFDLTRESAQRVLASVASSTREVAFQTIVQNRTSHGGILAPGAGAIKHGENRKGISSRWYAKTLSRRILDIGAIRRRLKFIEGDAFEIMRQHKHDPNATFFLDPPYTASTKRAGSRLYRYHQIDHDELFRLASEVAGDFLMTYDDAEEVRAMAEVRGFDTRLVAMNNTHHATMNELLIGRDLSWLW